MEQNSQMGVNRTGVDMSPIHSKKMSEASQQTEADPRSDDREAKTYTAYDREAGNGVASIAAFERSYLEEADPLGSVPTPGTAKGAFKSLMKAASGRRPQVFMNKLGQRLAFERSGVRIYDQLITKCEARDRADDPQIPVARLKEFRNQEAEHFHLLVRAMEKLGADPTAQTPDADASAVASSGLMKVILDPRTSISQSLEAMLAIEMTDNAAWELLIMLADDMGLDDMALEFNRALEQEQVHLTEIRQWMEDSVRGELH
jgi:rubrerythrin